MTVFRRCRKNICAFAVITALLLLLCSCNNNIDTPEISANPADNSPDFAQNSPSPVTTPETSTNPVPEWYDAYYKAITNYDYEHNVYRETSVTICGINADDVPVLWFYEQYEWGNLSKVFSFINGEVVLLFEEEHVKLFLNTANGETAFFAAIAGNGWGEWTFWLPYAYQWNGTAFVPKYTNKPAQGYEEYCIPNGLWLMFSSDELEASWEFATKEQYAKFLQYAEGKLIGNRHNDDGTETQLSVAQYYEETTAYLSNMENVPLHQLDMMWNSWDSGIELLTTEKEITDFLNSYISKEKAY